MPTGTQSMIVRQDHGSVQRPRTPYHGTLRAGDGTLSAVPLHAIDPQ
jgi:hypothetical protein